MRQSGVPSGRDSGAMDGLMGDMMVTGPKSGLFWPLAVLLMAISWLIPHHAAPWLNFLQESYVVLVLAVVMTVSLVRVKRPIEINALHCSALVLATLPLLQWLTGSIASFGTAWIHSLFLFGLFIAFVLGAFWAQAKWQRGPDFLFSAFLVAAIVSVGLQLAQWLSGGDMLPWVFPAPESRYYANLAQPNLLGSLLLLGCVGVAWGFYKKLIGGFVATVAVLFLLIGLVLTESRTGFLNALIVGVLLSCFWKKERPFLFALVVSGMLVVMLAMYAWLPEINAWLGHPVAKRPPFDPVRLAMWSSLLGYLPELPFFGTGWGQIAEAAMLSPGFPSMPGATRYSHNLLLDLMLSNGLVIGGGILLGLAYFAVRLLKQLMRKEPDFSIPFAAVSVLTVHAMLELPLAYAYFLLPYGLLLGWVSVPLQMSRWFVVDRRMALLVIFGGLLATVVTIRDYQVVERSFFDVAYGIRGEPVPPAARPDLIVLTQWRDRFDFVNTAPGPVFSDEEFERAVKIVSATPSPLLLYMLSYRLAASGQPEIARFWLAVLCRNSPPPVILSLQEKWREDPIGLALRQTVAWTSCSGEND